MPDNIDPASGEKISDPFELIAALKERLNSPVAGTFIIMFLLVNWRAFAFFILGEEDIHQKFSHLNQHHQSLCYLVLYPLGLTILYLGIYPWINGLADRYRELVRAYNEKSAEKTRKKLLEHQVSLQHHLKIIERTDTIRELKGQLESSQTEIRAMYEEINFHEEEKKKLQKRLDESAQPAEVKDSDLISHEPHVEPGETSIFWRAFPVPLDSQSSSDLATWKNTYEQIMGLLGNTDENMPRKAQPLTHLKQLNATIETENLQQAEADGKLRAIYKTIYQLLDLRMLMDRLKDQRLIILKGLTQEIYESSHRQLLQELCLKGEPFEAYLSLGEFEDAHTLYLSQHELEHWTVSDAPQEAQDYVATTVAIAQQLGANLKFWQSTLDWPSPATKDG